MSLIEICIVAITVAFVILVIYAVKVLNNLNRTLDNVHGITESIHEKTKALDNLVEQLKELDGIIKYAKIGFDVVKNLKNKNKKMVLTKQYKK